MLLVLRALRRALQYSEISLCSPQGCTYRAAARGSLGPAVEACLRMPVRSVRAAAPQRVRGIVTRGRTVRCSAGRVRAERSEKRRAQCAVRQLASRWPRCLLRRAKPSVRRANRSSTGNGRIFFSPLASAPSSSYAASPSPSETSSGSAVANVLPATGPACVAAAARFSPVGLALRAQAVASRAAHASARALLAALRKCASKSVSGGADPTRIRPTGRSISTMRRVRADLAHPPVPSALIATARVQATATGTTLGRVRRRGATRSHPRGPRAPGGPASRSTSARRRACRCRRRPRGATCPCLRRRPAPVEGCCRRRRLPPGEAECHCLRRPPRRRLGTITGPWNPRPVGTHAPGESDGAPVRDGCCGPRAAEGRYYISP